MLHMEIELNLNGVPLPWFMDLWALATASSCWWRTDTARAAASLQARNVLKDLVWKESSEQRQWKNDL